MGGVHPSTEDEYARELRRVIDRLRTLPLPSLDAPVGGFPSRSAAARATAQELADLGADVEGHERRALPALAATAVADQLAVCATDLLERSRNDPFAAQALPRGLATLTALRRLL